MFIPFFYLLRSRGLRISLNEWMIFTEALDKGFSGADLTQFYYLARALLVKSESDYDKFDRVFLEFFKDIEFDSEKLSEALMKALNDPNHERKGDQGRGEMVLGLSDEKIRQMLKERLEEQKDGEHNGGTYWVGTDGASAFGNNGEGLKGIRVGGVSRRRRAFHVAGERKFKDFREDTELDTRSFQMAFRSLRQFSSKIDAPRTELSIKETIQKTSDNAGRLKLVFEKPRKNTVKLLLLMDSGGSMDEHSEMCASLFHAVNKSNHFKDLKIFYFHNCVRDYLYKTPAIWYRESIETDWVLHNIDSDYKVIIIGDALMSNWELVNTRYLSEEEKPSGIARLRMLKERYPHLVWLNPTKEIPYEGDYWGQSYFIIKNEVEMYSLTVENLSLVMKKLMVNR